MSDPRYTIAVAGPPGTGKSWFVSSVADVVGAEATLLLATKPREAKSFGYVSRNIPTELFYDAEWRPSLGSYKAGGFVSLLRRLEQLFADDKYDAVILDVGTDAFELCKHELLMPFKAATPRDCPDSQSFYGSLAYKSKELTQALTLLQFAQRPKHVLMTIHTQPAKEDARTRDQTTSDKRAKGIEFEGSVLPMIEGSHRYGFAGEFDAVVYSDIAHTFDAKERKTVTKYVLQIAPDAERHAKVAVAPALQVKTIGNSFQEFLGVVRG